MMPRRFPGRMTPSALSRAIVSLSCRAAAFAGEMCRVLRPGGRAVVVMEGTDRDRGDRPPGGRHVRDARLDRRSGAADDGRCRVLPGICRLLQYMWLFEGIRQ